MGDMSGILHSVLEIQSERARVYNSFESLFSLYLKNRDEAAYKRHCSDITAQFSSLSKRMISIRDELLVNQSGEMSSQMGLLVGKIQTLEKEKLEATVIRQLVRKSRQEDEVRKGTTCCGHDQDFLETGPDAQILSDLLKKLEVIVTEINDCIFEIKESLDETFQ